MDVLVNGGVDVQAQIYFYSTSALGQFNPNYQMMTYPNVDQCALGNITTELMALVCAFPIGCGFSINFYADTIFRIARSTGSFTAGKDLHHYERRAMCGAPTNSYPNPFLNYFSLSEYSIIYDDRRKALYNFIQERTQINSQNMYLFMDHLSFD